MMDVISGQIAQTVNGISMGKTAQALQNTSKADKAAQDFEAVYISQMITPMFAGIETDGMFGGGNAENIYRSMMIDEYGKMIAQSGGIGLADSVKASILEMQAQQQAQGTLQE